MGWEKRVCWEVNRGSFTHLIGTRADQGIVTEIAADISGNDLAVDAIAWYKVLVLSRGRRRCLGASLLARTVCSRGHCKKALNRGGERKGWRRRRRGAASNELQQRRRGEVKETQDLVSKRDDEKKKGSE